MIDAHVHVWQLARPECRWPGRDLPALHRDYCLADVRKAAGTRIARVVLVQSQPDEADTRWLLGLAADDADVAGVVGWSDLAAADAATRLDALAAAGPLVGVRPMVQDCADDWYDDPAIDAGLVHLARRGLVLEALVRPRHLPALSRLAARHPGLRIVIDHAAKPAIGGDTAAWGRSMQTLAGKAQVACKLSGLLTEIIDDGPVDVAVPLMKELMAMFGPERLIWGSDWPVVTLRTSYRGWLDMALDVVGREHRTAVFGDNTARIYRLRAPTSEMAT